MEGVRNPSIPFLGMNVLAKKNRPVTGSVRPADLPNWCSNTNTFAKVWPEPDQTVNRTVLYIRTKVAEPPHFPKFSLSELRELVQRIDSESILYQFLTIHRRLPIAITFDLELRLTHRLRLLEACSIPFDSTPHM
ncbi:hypothetical protein PIB30_100439, partial [Stylosanthes scabra]|nr:hypothetical protein [Stylosanthes scabra]